MLHCPRCGEEVHRASLDDPRPVDLVGLEAEAACIDHLVARHPWRFRLWRRFGWDWLLTGVAR